VEKGGGLMMFDEEGKVPDLCRFYVEFEVANNVDRVLADDGIIEPYKVRRARIRGLVDPGATRLVLPGSVVKKLGLSPTKKVKVRYADRHTATRDAVEAVHVKLLGRTGTFTAMIEPRRRSALIGAIVLEDLGFLVDCTRQRLVPRDPKFVVSEIE
jgi:predicted aspartyl protease